jgi:hypothetical protein
VGDSAPEEHLMACKRTYRPLWAISTIMGADMTDMEIDLGSEGVTELIRLTNEQFGFWGAALAVETEEPIPSGDLMDHWFILSQLALCGPTFRMRKKNSYGSVPHLKSETVRKYVSKAGSLGFVETVKTKGEVYLQLTPAGQRAVAKTMARWIQEFGKIQRTHFPNL